MRYWLGPLTLSGVDGCRLACKSRESSETDVGDLVHRGRRIRHARWAATGAGRSYGLAGSPASSRFSLRPNRLAVGGSGVGWAVHYVRCISSGRNAFLGHFPRQPIPHAEMGLLGGGVLLRRHVREGRGKGNAWLPVRLLVVAALGNIGNRMLHLLLPSQPQVTMDK